LSTFNYLFNKMLRSLYIQNYALIEKLDIDFGSGFSVITGETGAGKSIILGAIGLLLGQRADVKSIRRGAAKCVIEARVEIAGYTKMSVSFAAKSMLRARAVRLSTIRLPRWYR
jgi:DNA repair ATPase RecN